MIRTSYLHPLVTARIEADHMVCMIERKNLDLSRLHEICRKDLQMDGKKIYFLMQCGICYIDGSCQSVSRVCDRARLASEHVMDGYAQPYAVFEKNMTEAYIDKTTLFSAISQAMEQENLKVYYQPLVDTKTWKIASAEALIRWIDPVRGMIPPGAFIPYLEENGRISMVDLYVAKRVHRLIRKRREEERPMVPVSINLSWMDFFDATITNWLVGALEEEKTKGRKIHLEITETSFAALEENRNHILEEYRNQGTEILLDDFGSGFSSFGMIQDYNFDILKIDMSFVRKISVNSKSRCIIRSIVDLAHQIGLRTVAEGAETKEQVDFLAECGCDYIQGYYFFKPMPEEDFMRLLDEEASGSENLYDKVQKGTLV